MWTLEESYQRNGPKKYFMTIHGPLEGSPDEVGFILTGLVHPDVDKFIYVYDLLNDLPIEKIMGGTSLDQNFEAEIEFIEDDQEEGGADQ